MLINNDGNLSKEYFIAYLKLIMSSRKCTLEKAKEITFERLFQKDKKTLGNISFERFTNAYEGLKEEGK
ncbi:hypothetical protein HV417_15865 [Bacillus sporothermodurans]|uniref:hypothetical protein n=1 Tax=Heyndrickxia sporothermodurans TaxID=46224 RepID=UPI00192AA2EE|nr:hypothetical protein [Heyndrickxia sporothermodurans]MBL5874949.1 hypothetical protein [Heyndrickxia sporothermodurans]